MSMIDDIVEYLQRNRVSTTEVADALGKTGVLPRVAPVTQDLYVVGKVRPIFAAGGSNYAVHEQARDVESGDVVVVYTHGCEERAIFGDLVARYILFYRGAKAIVVNGAVRDAARLRRERYPIWSDGVTPLGCVNTQASEFPTAERAKIEREVLGGIAVCDEGGVVIIPTARATADMLDRLARIEMQEDAWSFCLNTLKWSTFDIVCKKRYLSETEVLPAPMREALEGLQKSFES